MSRPIMPTRILIVGGGGREHALAWKLAAEPGVNAVYVAPGSDAIAAEQRVECEEVQIADLAGLVDLARRRSIELAVIGPEAALAAGVTDALVAAGVPTFGPTMAAARIESSKGFCREVATAAGVPMAEGASFDDERDAIVFARTLAARGGVVVKQDGLAAGKGVVVCESGDEAEAAILDIVGSTHSPVIVEERLLGREASVIALCDGRDAVALPISRDHKRLGDGDTGPNTGGMGAYSPLPDLPDAEAADILDTFHRPVLAELARRDIPFRGALYAGLMLTSEGPRLLEFNARFGDPETQVVLPRVATALGPILLAAARGQLPLAMPSILPTIPSAAVGIVLAAAGYPGLTRRGDPIDGLDEAAHAGSLVFHAGTIAQREGAYATNGGRVLTVVDTGDDLDDARFGAERAAGLISWSGMQRRHDIGLKLPPAVAVGATS